MRRDRTQKNLAEFLELRPSHAIDLGEGVACIELHSKKNAIGVKKRDTLPAIQIWSKHRLALSGALAVA